MHRLAKKNYFDAYKCRNWMVVRSLFFRLSETSQNYISNTRPARGKRCFASGRKFSEVFVGFFSKTGCTGN